VPFLRSPEALVILHWGDIILMLHIHNVHLSSKERGHCKQALYLKKNNKKREIGNLMSKLLENLMNQSLSRAI
jgi:hypothetical protein